MKVKATHSMLALVPLIPQNKQSTDEESMSPCEEDDNTSVYKQFSSLEGG